MNRPNILALLILLPALASGASYLVPDDAALVRAADAIGIVRVLSTHSSFTADGRIATEVIVRVERGIERLHDGETAAIVTPGGVVGDLAMSVSSAPAFVPGERALVLLRETGRGRYTILSGELGKFSFVLGPSSRELLVRGAGEREIFGWDLAGNRHLERARDAARFLRFVESIAAGEAAEADYFRSGTRSVSSDAHVPPSDYVTLFNFSGGKLGARWPEGSFTMFSVGTEAAVSDLPAAIDRARNAWNTAAGAAIALGYGGPTTDATPKDYAKDDDRFLIFFDQKDCTSTEVANGTCPLANDPLDGSTVGQATFWASSRPIVVGPSTFGTAVDCDIVIELGLGGNLFEEVLAHEMGHCLGFRHSNDPGEGQVTNTGDALMNSTVRGTRGAVLREWDGDAASHVYPAVCEGP
ncbi:MAG: hypothetical protein ACRD2J_10560, partial [Thermoanaerobaculia bacterium]